jgi:iron complex outermembrane receptor protein
LFGSGAIGGIVQLYDNPSFTNGFHGQIGYGYGSTNWQNRYANLHFKHQKIGISAKIAYQNADNDFTFRNTAEIGQPLKKAIHASFNYLNINASFYYDMSENDKLKIHFWRSQNYREITPTMTAINTEAIYRDTANRIVGEWTHFFKHFLKQSFLKVRTAYVYDKNFYESNVIQNSQNGIRTSINEAEWNYNFSEKHQIRAGINATFEQSDNSNYTKTHQRTRLALFLNDVLRTRFVDLTGSLRQEWLNNQITPTTFSVGFEKNVLNRHTSPLTSHTSLLLRGSLSRNFNIPTFNDLYWVNLGNQNLVNEQGWSKELGLSFKRKSEQKLLQAHITFFDIDIKNHIVWLPQIDGQWRPTNLQTVLSRGFETWANYQVKQTHFQYRISVNYQFADAKDNNGDVQRYTPQHKGGISIWGQYKTFYLAWQQTASSRRYATTDKTTWTKAFTLSDANVGYTPSVGKQKVDIRLSIFNVLNIDYQVIPFFPNPKRQFRVEATISF